MPSLFLQVNPDDRRSFERIFQVKFLNYFDGLFGFDVIKFDDEVIKPRKNESTEQAILRKHNQQAVDLIRRLISIL